MFGPTNPMSWTNIAPAAMSKFPRNWTLAMAQRWMDDPVRGFNAKACHAWFVMCSCVCVAGAMPTFSLHSGAPHMCGAEGLAAQR